MPLDNNSVIAANQLREPTLLFSAAKTWVGICMAGAKAQAFHEPRNHLYFARALDHTLQVGSNGTGPRARNGKTQGLLFSPTQAPNRPKSSPRGQINLHPNSPRPDIVKRNGIFRRPLITLNSVGTLSPRLCHLVASYLFSRPKFPSDCPLTQN